MDLFCTTVQIDEHPLIDITDMPEQELMELLGVTWIDDIPSPAV